MSSRELKIKEQIGPEIKIKDTVAMRTKPAMEISTKTLKTGAYMSAASMLSEGIDAADPHAKETASKYKNEIAATKELKREGKALTAKTKPLRQKLRVRGEKKVFKKAAGKNLKTKTAYSPLLSRRKAYEERYRKVMQARKKEQARRFTRPVKTAWQESNAGKTAQKVTKAASEKVAKVSENQIAKQTIKLIQQLVAATKALVRAIVAVGGVAIIMPLIILLVFFSVFPVLSASSDAAGDGVFASPFGKTSYTVTSEFGTRIDPITGVKTQHDGYDVCASTGEGSPVYAVYDGTILSAYDGSKSATGYGSYVILGIDAEGFEDDITVLYGHLSDFVVKAGDKVEIGQLIGFEGNTGKSTGPHLHFEVRLDGEPIDGKMYWDL